jgi:hypothetical protein
MSQSRVDSGDWQTANAEGWSESCRETASATVEEYPLSVTIGMFAIGLSLGVAVGAALARPLHLDQRRTAESLGRRLLDSLHEYVPASVNQYLKS